jgi:hypothetical protein
MSLEKLKKELESPAKELHLKPLLRWYAYN